MMVGGSNAGHLTYGSIFHWSYVKPHSERLLLKLRTRAQFDSPCPSMITET
jgi:hypothetical protein